MSAVAVLFFASSSFGQLKGPGPEQPHPDGIHLDVVVTGRDGKPVQGLQQADFTVLDNGVPQKIASFKPMSGDAAPVEVIILVDAVNSAYSTVAYERQQMDKYFLANGGKLPYQTTLAIFSDQGTEIMRGFTRDGASLSAALDRYTISLRALRRSAGVYGAGERLDLSLHLLQQLTAAEGRLPGRKIVLWMSPGWPFLSGAEISLDNKQEQFLFREIEDFSTNLRQSRMTLYSIDPLGNENVGANYYRTFLKGVRKPNQVQYGDVALQVLATQSGGLALNFSNDLAAQMHKAVNDVGSFYELAYDPPAGEPNEYHRIDVKVSEPGLTARTRTGYYSQQ